MEPLAPQSTAFSSFDERIQKWIWEQGWTELRDAQESAANPILEGEKDLIIAAATASGKTEAAFLPICSNLLKNPIVSVLYISPLKALINDQFSRMEKLCENLDIPVHPWHGDISSARKKKFLEDPQGVLLITPESTEAIFVNQGHSIPFLFKNLAYVVIDELHSFIGTERGCQLQSLLHRLEFSIKRKIPRIGLSATLGDMGLAAEFLRPGYGNDVLLIVSKTSGQELRLLLKGYLHREPDIAPLGGEEESAAPSVEEDDSSVIAIRDSLFKTLRGSNNLVFANSRSNVEKYADLLRRLCEEEKVPNAFWPHHGSLSKELREDAEKAIKEKTQPVSIICTSTLEMGIDIGAVDSIAQIGVPPSVASMRQRLGRSGRRAGKPAILRIYIEEDEITKNTHPVDALRADLVQTIAMVKLLIAKWYEPPAVNGLHLSTLIQQIMSVIAQYGGVTAEQAWKIICHQAVFATVDQAMLANLLRSMGKHELICQGSDGFLLHGRQGEKIVNHYSFYTAFTTYEEYRLISGTRTLGTLPIDRPVSEGSLLIFAGRRWSVISVDSHKKIIELVPATGGKPPRFGGDSGWFHDVVRREMFAIYTSEEVPQFLDARAIELLKEGRETFRRLDLLKRRIVDHGNDSMLFYWAGDKIMNTIAVQLRARGLKAENEKIAILVTKTDAQELEKCLEKIVKEGPADPLKLAATIQNKAKEKYDLFLSEELMSADYASSKLDTIGAWELLNKIVKEEKL